jgi:hypothetical protein
MRLGAGSVGSMTRVADALEANARGVASATAVASEFLILRWWRFIAVPPVVAGRFLSS